MQQNMGSADVFVRTMVGIGFLVNIFSAETGVVGTIILLLLGLLFLATAWINFCPAYKPLGICTCACGAHSDTEKSE